MDDIESAEPGEPQPKPRRKLVPAAPAGPQPKPEDLVPAAPAGPWVEPAKPPKTCEEELKDKNAEIVRLGKELDEKNAKITQLEKQVADLQAKLEVPEWLKALYRPSKGPFKSPGGSGFDL